MKPSSIELNIFLRDQDASELISHFKTPTVEKYLQQVLYQGTLR